MNKSKVVYNERAWGSDLNVELNRWLRAHRTEIGKSSAEHGVTADDGSSTLFPDILLFSKEHDVVMGWELKFPDTPISDKDTYDNAVEKANRLRTNSFVIWNYNIAQIHVRKEDGWIVVQEFSLDNHVKRRDITSMDTDWVPLVNLIMTAVVELRATGAIRDGRLEVFLGEPTYREILEANVSGQAALLEREASGDRRLDSQFRMWAEESTSLVKPRREEVFRLAAEVQIINWVNKIIFCHYLKTVSEDAFAIDSLNLGSTLDDLQDLFEVVSSTSDFKSIFSPVLGQKYITRKLLESLLQLNEVLKVATAESGGDFRLGDSLASGMKYLRGKVSGQFATPERLAQLLIGITMLRMRGTVIDPCCGSGTIARQAIEAKKRFNHDVEDVYRTVWASDKFSIPVGFTGVALADPCAMGEVQQVFRSDVADLRTGDLISFVDPNSGKEVERRLPRFDTVVSNLPFVRFEVLKESNDLAKLVEFAESPEIDAKSDLYAYIVLGLRRLMADSGRLGVIVSNSFMGTAAGRKLRDLLLDNFHIEAVVTSGNRRWFSNADVITSIIVLTAKVPSLEVPNKVGQVTQIISTLDPIEEWTDESVNELIDSILVKRTSRHITRAEVEENVLRESGVYWPYLGEMEGLHARLVDSMVPLSDHFVVKRGLRPNAERHFFLKKEEVKRRGIETDYLVPLIHRPAKSLTALPLANVPAQHYLVNCSRSLNEVRALGHNGIERWILSFASDTTTKGIPFPEALSSSEPFWYTPKAVPTGDLFVQMNPDRIFGTYRPRASEAVASQRLITLTSKTNLDVSLGHALLNSSVFSLWQEITGFPKGLGALDRNATQFQQLTFMPDPAVLSESQKREILEAFEPIASRPALRVQEELEREDRQRFDAVVHRAAGIDAEVEEIYRLLRKFVAARTNV